MKRNQMHEFTVRGKGRFPVDMLRYDQCFPLDGESAENIIAPTGRREVSLGTYSTVAPTVGRWNSFLWGLLSLVLLISTPVYAQGLLVGQWVEGQTRFCKYNDAGRIYIRSIHSSNPCPPSD